MSRENTVASLCKKYTELSDRDISIIEGMSVVLKPLANLEDADIFIDCPSTGEDAIVVAEAKPDYVPSSYRNTVVGLLAKPQNEPAVARTLKLGIATKQMKAITQENTHVIQTVEPIKNDGRVIGVLIREKRVDEERAQSEPLHFSQQSYNRITSAITHMTKEHNWLTECIDEALVIVDKDGYVTYRNSLASKLYNKFGYVNDILGQPYDNIMQICPSDTTDDLSGLTEVEVGLGKNYLSISHVDLSSQGMGFALIIRDITDKKERERELILKSIAIQEMHHRIKNNLQTIASLLRLQIRRAHNPETQMVLRESMSRILSIAVTHELLSQEGIDRVNIGEVIINITNNTLQYLEDSNNNVNIRVEVTLDGEDFQIDADVSTSVALVVNELLQNSIEHAFSDRRSGTVQIIISKGDLYSTIKIIDDGCGFDTAETRHLGLNIVRVLVKDKLGGNFKIDSNKGGTCASFDFKVS